MSLLAIGDQIQIDIRKQGINGEGIGYYNKLAIFVPGAILKETVKVTIDSVNNGYATAKVDEILQTSKKRILAPCKFYDKCGGCQMQHIDYTEQLKIKQSILKQSLRRYFPELQNEEIISKTVGMEDPYHYRNKSQMPFRNLNFGLSLGLYQTNSNKFVYVDECATTNQVVNKINQDTLSTLRAYHVLANDSSNKEGILLYLVTRYFESTNQASVTFIVTKYNEILKTIAEKIVSKNSAIKSVSYSINRGGSLSVFGKATKIILGKPKIEDRVNGMSIQVSPDAFHQLNSTQMINLYDLLYSELKLTGKEIVIDGYCGIGITSLSLAKKCRKVYGIDYSLSSIKDARENAIENHIDNVEMIADNVESELPRLIKSGVQPSIVILDPPRTGLNYQVIEALNQVSVETIVYISCNPSTLAKNLKDLSTHYDVEKIIPMDMFPETSNVESITFLHAKKRG